MYVENAGIIIPPTASRMAVGFMHQQLSTLITSSASSLLKVLCPSQAVRVENQGNVSCSDQDRDGLLSLVIELLAIKGQGKRVMA